MFTLFLESLPLIKSSFHPVSFSNLDKEPSPLTTATRAASACVCCVGSEWSGVEGVSRQEGSGRL